MGMAGYAAVEVLEAKRLITSIVVIYIYYNIVIVLYYIVLRLIILFNLVTKVLDKSVL